MGEIINKLLLFNDDIDKNFVQKKMDLLTKVLEELKSTKEQEKYQCICSCLESDFYNKSFVADFFKEGKFIEILYTILDESKDDPKKLISVMKLLIRINENILKNIDKRISTPVEQENPMEIINMFNNTYTLEDNNKEIDGDMEQIIKGTIVFLLNCLLKNKFNFLDDLDDCSSQENVEFKSTYLVDQKKMGMKKLAQIELFRTILDIMVNTYGLNIEEEICMKLFEIIKENKLLTKINKLFFDFPFCNIYQSYYMQVYDLVINEFSPKTIIEAALVEKNEQEGKNLIEILIENALNNMKFTFVSTKTAIHPNFSFEVSLLTKIFSSKNKYLLDIIKENKNLEVFHKVIGEEVSNIFGQRLLYNDNEVQFTSHDEPEEKKPSFFFGQKTFMDLMEEDIKIYKLYLDKGNYEKALEQKINREKLEKEKMEKEEEEKKKTEDDVYFNEEDEQEDNKKLDIKDEVEEEKEEKDEKEEKEENVGEKDEKEEGVEEKKESEKEESSTEETEKDKDYNDVNYWKVDIIPNDDIMSSIINDLD